MERGEARRIDFSAKDALNKLRKDKPDKQTLVWDGGSQAGLHMLVSPGPAHMKEATLTLRVCFYMKNRPGVPRYKALGRWPDGKHEHNGTTYQCADIKRIRLLAGLIRDEAKTKDIDPNKAVVSTRFGDVVRDFIEIYAKLENRHWRKTELIFATYVLPRWGDLDIDEIKRTSVATLLDAIATRKLKHPKTGQLIGGRVTADAVLAALSKMFNWYATRKDDFASPIVRGMKRAKSTKERARQRVLSDNELRMMWPVLGESGTYGAAVKTILLTAQRARKVGLMRRSEIKSVNANGQVFDHVWDAAGDDPENKGTSPVPLSPMVRDIIAAVPIIDADEPSDFVFSVNGQEPFNGWSRAKARLDHKLSLNEPWQLRDLRRTARTLMSRNKTSLEISERCLGHVMTVVRGTYDRYDYLAEKREAFDKLSAAVAGIVKGTNQ